MNRLQGAHLASDLRGWQACVAADELSLCRSTKAVLKSFEASREDMREPVTVQATIRHGSASWHSQRR